MTPAKLLHNPRISIHAPREGCDYIAYAVTTRTYTFQSTHPVRGATIVQYRNGGCVLFQSTHPVRGATRVAVWVC